MAETFVDRVQKCTANTLFLTAGFDGHASQLHRVVILMILMVKGAGYQGAASDEGAIVLDGRKVLGARGIVAIELG